MFDLVKQPIEARLPYVGVIRLSFFMFTHTITKLIPFHSFQNERDALTYGGALLEQ